MLEPVLLPKCKRTRVLRFAGLVSRFFIIGLMCTNAFGCGGQSARKSMVQPAASQLPLFTLNTPTAGQVGGQGIYQGAFVTPADFAGDSNTYSDSQQIAGAPNSDRMFLTMISKGTAGIYRISCVTRPGKLSTSNKLKDLPMATGGDTTINLKQSVQDIMSFDSGSNGPVIRGMYYDPDTDTLTAGVSGYYDSDPKAGGIAVIAGASDLSSATVKGLIPTQGGRRLGWWVSPLPAAYQKRLGTTHLVGSGHGASIISSTSLGPAMFGVNLSEVYEAKVGGKAVNTPAFVEYLHSADGSQVVGVDGKPGISKVLRSNLLWNMLTGGSMNMLIPGTRSVLWLGTGWSGDGSIQYKPSINLDVTELSFNVGYYKDTYTYTLWLDDYEVTASARPGENSDIVLKRLYSLIKKANIPNISVSFDGSYITVKSPTPRHMSVSNFLGTTKGGQSPGYNVVNTHNPKAHYYMLFDLDDVVAAHKSRGNGSDVKPYEHGHFSPDQFPFAMNGANASRTISGGYISAVTDSYVEITLAIDDGARGRAGSSHALYSVFRLNL